MDPKQPLKNEIFRSFGRMFGVVVCSRPGKSNPLCHLFFEDDGHWHWKDSFDVSWSDDLFNVIRSLKSWSDLKNDTAGVVSLRQAFLAGAEVGYRRGTGENIIHQAFEQWLKEQGEAGRK